MKNPRRTVVLSMGVVWAAGTLRGDGGGNAVVDGLLGRTVGVLIATLLLSALAGPMPEVAAGVAMIAAATTLIARAGDLAKWQDKVLRGAKG